MPSLNRAVSAFLGSSPRERPRDARSRAGAEKPGPARHPLAARTPDLLLTCLGEGAMYKELRSMPKDTTYLNSDFNSYSGR